MRGSCGKDLVGGSCGEVLFLRPWCESLEQKSGHEHGSLVKVLWTALWRSCGSLKTKWVCFRDVLRDTLETRSPLRIMSSCAEPCGPQGWIQN